MIKKVKGKGKYVLMRGVRRRRRMGGRRLIWSISLGF